MTALLPWALYVWSLVSVYRLGRCVERWVQERTAPPPSWKCPDCHLRFEAPVQWMVDNFADNHTRYHLGIDV